MSVPAENVTKVLAKVILAADGSATINGQNVIRGVQASNYRRVYESETGRRERFEQNFSRSYPGAKVADFILSEPRAIEKPVETTYSLAVPRLGRVDERGISFSPLGEPWRFTEGNAPLSKRQYPIDLGAPWTQEFSYDVALPEGYALADGPFTVEKTSPFGTYRYVLQQSPAGVTLSGHVSFTAERVAPEQYPAYRSFLEELDRTFSRRLRLTPAVPSMTTEAAR
jgi:hypothetical protein